MSNENRRAVSSPSSSAAILADSLADQNGKIRTESMEQPNSVNLQQSNGSNPVLTPTDCTVNASATKSISSGRFVPPASAHQVNDHAINYHQAANASIITAAAKPSVPGKSTKLVPSKRNQPPTVTDNPRGGNNNAGNAVCTVAVDNTCLPTNWRLIKPSTEKPVRKIAQNGNTTKRQSSSSATTTPKRQYNRRNPKFTRQSEILDAARTLVFANQLGQFQAQQFDISQHLTSNNSQSRNNPSSTQTYVTSKAKDVIVTSADPSQSLAATLAQPQLIFRTAGTAMAANQQSSAQIQSLQRPSMAFNCNPQVFQCGSNGTSFQLVPVGSTPFQFVNCPNSSQLLLAHTQSYEELIHQTSMNNTSRLVNNSSPILNNLANHSSTIINRVAHCSEESSTTTSKSLPNSDDSFDSYQTTSSELQHHTSHEITDKQEETMQICYSNTVKKHEKGHVVASTAANNQDPAASTKSSPLRAFSSTESPQTRSNCKVTEKHSPTKTETTSNCSLTTCENDDDTVTHVLDGFVIKESKNPFPAIQYGFVNNLYNKALNSDANDTNVVDTLSTTVQGKQRRSTKVSRRRATTRQQTKRDNSKTIENEDKDIDKLDRHSLSKPKRSRRTSPTATPLCLQECSVIVPANVLETKTLNDDPDTWTIDEVSNFILERTNNTELAEKFRSHEVDGSALLLVKEEFLMQFMDMKLGPALKLCSRIADLKKRYTHSNLNIT
ncbi:hypothetical protein GJ496_009462 [Pomphorhynchus laevis]|nr:hypothetical protein GJ496_009462 [Pomphorhynchus laevis]